MSKNVRFDKKKKTGTIMEDGKDPVIFKLAKTPENIKAAESLGVNLDWAHYAFESVHGIKP